jgi:metal-responsive CopG/Arc/MetJ family transcriptional regulator
MKPSINAKQKKRGRPATGKTPMIGLRLSPEVAAAVDAWAAKHGLGSRSAAIRQMIDQAIAAKTRRK